MSITSFDIFDTCLVRKCGTPENFLDVLSLRAFTHEPLEWARQEFVAARIIAERTLWNANPYHTLQDIWVEFDWSHQFLKSKKELCQLEQELERDMLVPVLSMRDKVNECRKRGDKIIFISDMYLSSDFLIEILHSYGFYHDGDVLYVSCECGAMKWNGGLFEYVRKQENMPSFQHWHHYGDNKQGDYIAPKKLGIKCTLINHAYTPYQQQWIDNDCSLGFKYSSILAGIGRAINKTIPDVTDIKPFTLDIVAPFYMTLLVRILNDAKQRNITHLFFSARDAYCLYLMAQRLQPMFPSIKIGFAYMSRQSLYDNPSELKWRYCEQIGLASKTDNVGLVDIRSSGKTLQYLNDNFERLGYRTIRGYLFELYSQQDMKYLNSNCYREACTPYAFLSPATNYMLRHGLFYEQLFALNTLKRTIGYRKDGSDINPIFDDIVSEADPKEQYNVNDIEAHSIIHQNILKQYVDLFMDVIPLGYADKIYENIAMPTIIRFFKEPDKFYLKFFTKCKGRRENKMVNYVNKEHVFKLLITRGKDSMWSRATILYSLPEWVNKVLIYYVKNRH